MDNNKSKGGFVSVKFSEMRIPIFKETFVPAYNYYLPSEDGKWFLNLIELYDKSTVHSNIINNLLFQITKEQQENEFYKQVVLDYILLGAFAVEVIWNIDHTSILKMNHLDVSKVRIGKPDENNDPLFYFYSNDWFKYSNRKVDMIQAYNPSEGFDQHQIYYAKRYIVGEDVYSKPYYYGGLKWILTDVELENYYANLVQNNFVPNTLIDVPAFIDEARQKEFEKDLKESFTGSQNAGRIFVTYSEDKDHTPTIQKFNNDEDDLKYRFLSEQIPVNISIAHNYPAPLLGILIPGKLGNTSDLPTFQTLYDENMVQPMKAEIDRKLAPLMMKKISID